MKMERVSEHLNNHPLCIFKVVNHGQFLQINNVISKVIGAFNLINCEVKYFIVLWFWGLFLLVLPSFPFLEI